jgi:hypothetical protein
MARIKITDLNVNLEELKKRDPRIMKKIRGGATSPSTGLQCLYAMKASAYLRGAHNNTQAYCIPYDVS